MAVGVIVARIRLLMATGRVRIGRIRSVGMAGAATHLFKRHTGESRVLTVKEVEG